MGQQVIKQPDGRFAVFSTETDTIVAWDATADEIVDLFAEQARDDAARHARDIVDKVAAGNAREVYHQLALSWGEALENDREHGGEASDEMYWRQQRERLERRADQP